MAVLNLEELRQGDIVRGGRVFFQAGHMPCLIKPKRRYRIVSSDTTDKKIHRWVMPARSSDLVVLTQSCDIRKLPAITFAPVTSLEIGLNKGQQDQVRAQRITYCFYLPTGLCLDSTHYQESYVDARIVCTIDKAVVESFTLIRHMDGSLREQFRKFLFNHYGRPAIEDEILQLLEPFTTVAIDSKTHKQIHSVWLNLYTKPCGLLAVFYESSPAVASRLEKSIEAVNSSQSKYQFDLKCKTLDSTKLVELQSYSRIAFDYLSLGKKPEFLSADLDM